MTAQLHRFPTSAAFVAQREAEARRQEIVATARAVLRGAARHSDAILTEACAALQTWGDATDWLQADAMLLALRQRERRLVPIVPRPKPAVRADEAALVLSMAFAVGMIGVVCAKAAGWWW